MKDYQTILFDLDGTLTDPKEGITKSVQYALNKSGIKVPEQDELVKFIGPPLVESFRKFFQLGHDQAWKAVEYYREYFSVRGMYENEVYPGIDNLLKDLSEQGKCLAVATSKPTIYSERILEYFKLDKYFSLVIGSNLDGSRVVKKEIIEIAQAGKDPGQTVMVGDRMHDVVGAHHNGIDSIAVAYGYGSIEELTNADPTYLVKTVQELGKLLL
ncbi:HAD family hydrolase [Syntrophomonas erecta]